MSWLCGFLLGFADPVGNHLREDHGQLHEPRVLVPVIPGALEDELLHTVLLHGVDVGPGVLQHVGKEAACRLGMAIQHVVPDELLPAGSEEGPAGLPVHVQDGSVLPADGDATSAPSK